MITILVVSIRIIPVVIHGARTLLPVFKNATAVTNIIRARHRHVFECFCVVIHSYDCCKSDRIQTNAITTMNAPTNTMVVSHLFSVSVYGPSISSSKLVYIKIISYVSNYVRLPRPYVEHFISRCHHSTFGFDTKWTNMIGRSLSYACWQLRHSVFLIAFMIEREGSLSLSVSCINTPKNFGVAT